LTTDEVRGRGPVGYDPLEGKKGTEAKLKKKDRDEVGKRGQEGKNSGPRPYLLGLKFHLLGQKKPGGFWNSRHFRILGENLGTF